MDTPLERERDAVLADMARLGYPIRGHVRIAVAPRLQATATTIPTEEGYQILVSPRVLDEGRLRGLLAHELAHVYRIDSKHASHDDDAITAAYASLPASAQEREFQRAFLHHAINIVEDLYADGIGFRVMEDIGALEGKPIGEFLEMFLTDEPFDIADEREHRWDVTHDVVNNARGLTMMKRHAAKEDVARAEATNVRLLARVPKDIAAAAPWFQRRFDTLPEDPTREEFARLLAEYVLHFVEVAEGTRPR